MKPALMVLCTLWGVTALAQPAFEQSQVERALESAGLLQDPLPQGKRVAFIATARAEVFVPTEALYPLLGALNQAHWLTNEAVIRDELLLKVGDLFESERAAESARNLRRSGIFAVVAVVPVLAKSPDEIGLLIVTRDLWSLRLESDYQFTHGELDELLLQLTERNLWGKRQRATLRGHLLPLTLTIGEAYAAPRLFNGAANFEQSADLIIERESGDFDGLRLALSVERPFYDLSQRWAFSFPLGYERRQVRQIRAGEILTFDDPTTTAVESLEREWSIERWTAAAVGRYQTGGALIQRLSLGLGLSIFDVQADQVPTANEAAFKASVLPTERAAVYPFIGYAVFTPRFRTYQDLATFGVSEDIQLGLIAQAMISAPLAGLGSDANALVLGASTAYAEDFAGDGLLEMGVGAEGRLEGGELLDQTLLGRVRGSSPRFGFGRVVARADWLLHRADTAKSLVTLGGDNGLRGFASQQFFGFGASRARANAEYRTPPATWSFVHAGLAAFYDAGTVYEDWDEAAFHQSVGVGLRLLFPQLNRMVTRLDFGVPVDGSGFVITFSGGSQQMVPMPGREDAEFTFDVGGLVNQP